VHYICIIAMEVLAPSYVNADYAVIDLNILCIKLTPISVEIDHLHI